MTVAGMFAALALLGAMPRGVSIMLIAVILFFGALLSWGRRHD